MSMKGQGAVVAPLSWVLLCPSSLSLITGKDEAGCGDGRGDGWPGAWAELTWAQVLRKRVRLAVGGNNHLATRCWARAEAARAGGQEWWPPGQCLGLQCLLVDVYGGQPGFGSSVAPHPLPGMVSPWCGAGTRETGFQASLLCDLGPHRLPLWVLCHNA